MKTIRLDDGTQSRVTVAHYIHLLRRQANIEAAASDEGGEFRALSMAVLARALTDVYEAGERYRRDGSYPREGETVLQLVSAMEFVDGDGNKFLDALGLNPDWVRETCAPLVEPVRPIAARALRELAALLPSAVAKVEGRAAREATGKKSRTEGSPAYWARRFAAQQLGSKA